MTFSGDATDTSPLGPGVLHVQSGRRLHIAFADIHVRDVSQRTTLARDEGDLHDNGAQQTSGLTS